ncbi:hypothetical protein HanIR_Chr05g0250131 [Helianthus annuus]|nr:hypothetical protein HanIR_Chr05g0250131 [Helianthus annuus]
MKLNLPAKSSSVRQSSTISSTTSPAPKTNSAAGSNSESDMAPASASTSTGPLSPPAAAPEDSPST